jgi:hypothetical protein
MSTVREVAVRDSVKLKGQVVIQKEGSPDFPLVFCCQPCGGYLCWFIDPTFPPMHRLYALVNENMKHIMSFPIEQAAEFREELLRMQKEMGEEEG